MERPVEDACLAVGQVHVGIDQTRDDPPAGDVHLEGTLRQLEAGPGADRFDPAAAHDDDGVRQRRTAGTIDHGGAHQRHPVGLPLPAGEQQAQPEGRGRAVHRNAHSARG